MASYSVVPVCRTIEVLGQDEVLGVAKGYDVILKVSEMRTRMVRALMLSVATTESNGAVAITSAYSCTVPQIGTIDVQQGSADG